MELELGIKITKSKGDLTSTTNFQMSKDSSGPTFMSTETETHFILSALLKGYRKENIKIKISEDGSEIVIRMEKAVEEMVISKWSVHKKELEMRGFIKAFRIPSGMVLDRIKVRFNDHDSVLTISMLKSVKGIRGEQIQELVEEYRQGFISKKNEDVQSSHGLIPEKNEDVQSSQGLISKKNEDVQLSQGLISKKNEDVKSSGLEEKLNNGKEFEDEMAKTILAQERVFEDQATKVEDHLNSKIESRDGNNQEEEVEEEELDSDGEKERDNVVEADECKKEEITNNNKESSGTIKLCKPCVLVGSSILVSLVIFAIHWIRSKKRQVQ